MWQHVKKIQAMMQTVSGGTQQQIKIQITTHNAKGYFSLWSNFIYQ
jgi:hypothetical protein